MQSAILNRLIRIDIESTSVNSVGTPEETYTLLKECFATIKYNTGATQYNEGAQAYSDIDFSIRWDSRINYKCRITYENVNYKILAIEYIGRKDGIRLKCIKFEL
jgi:SPP1 family predicted phage head-tail adaptor